MGFHKSNLLQHVLTSQILMDASAYTVSHRSLWNAYCSARISAAVPDPLFFTLSFRRLILSVQQRWFGSIFFRVTSPTGTIPCMIAKCTLPKSRCRFQYSSDFVVLYRYGRKFPRSSNRYGSCSYFRKYIRFNVFVILHKRMFIILCIPYKYLF